MEECRQGIPAGATEIGLSSQQSTWKMKKKIKISLAFQERFETQIQNVIAYLQASNNQSADKIANSWQPLVRGSSKTEGKFSSTVKNLLFNFFFNVHFFWGVSICCHTWAKLLQ